MSTTRRTGLCGWKRDTLFSRPGKYMEMYPREGSSSICLSILSRDTRETGRRRDRINEQDRILVSTSDKISEKKTEYSMKHLYALLSTHQLFRVLVLDSMSRYLRHLSIRRLLLYLFECNSGRETCCFCIVDSPCTLAFLPSVLLVDSGLSGAHIPYTFK